MTLYLNAVLTAAIELVFFALFGYCRNRSFVYVCVLMNLFTNLTLNLVISHYYSIPFLIGLELIVVITEYAAYAGLLGRSKKVFALTFVANLLTFATGVLLYGL